MISALGKKILLAVFAAQLCCACLFAKEIAVFEVRRALSFDDKQLPKDYYLNAGIEVGLKVGMTVTVNRRQTLYDPFQNKSPGDLIIPVGRLRIVHVQDNMSVARLEDILDRDNLPTLDFDAVMVGDRVDMATAKMGGGKRAESENKEEGSATSASSSPASEPAATVAPVQEAPVKQQAPVAITPPPVAVISESSSLRLTVELPTDGWDPLESTCRHASLSIL